LTRSPLATLALATAVLIGTPATQMLWTAPVAGTAPAAHPRTAQVPVTRQLALPATPQLNAPQTRWHFAPNSNFDSSWGFRPAVAGFNVADVSSAQQLDHLPTGVKAMVFVGTCSGVDAAFVNHVQPFLRSHKVLAYYLVDDPDPALCSAANLKDESDWLHGHSTVGRTFIVLMNLTAPSSPSYTPVYSPANTGIDYFGLDMYPCRSELAGCDYAYITKSVRAAKAAGVPTSAMVPMYQAFGGGTWADGAGGQFLVPTASQEKEIVQTWASLIPSPAFDYAYSWGRQRQDEALASTPSLRQFFAALYA
jgi:hypothetical protein